MNSWRRFFVAVGLTLASLLFMSLFSATAHAQEIVNDRTQWTSERRVWLRDSRMLEGQGIPVGPLTLHPGAALEVGYDSNYFQRTFHVSPDVVNGAPNAPSTDAVVARITPSLTLITTPTDPSLVGPPSYVFRTSVAATYSEFFGTQEIRDQRNIGGNLALRLDILPGRTIGGAFFAGYSRLIQPQALAVPDQSFNRSDVTGGVELAVTPGAGTLEMRLTYQFFMSLFEQPEGAPFSNIQNEIGLRTRWKVRPKTTIFQDTSVRLINYLQPERAFYFLNNSQPLRARIGAQSLITPRFQVLASIGYGTTFEANSASPLVRQYDTITGQAEVTFFPMATGDLKTASLAASSFSLGYLRDFQNSFLGSYIGYDRGYARANYFYNNRIFASLEGGVAALGYPDIVQNTGAGFAVSHAAFTDVRANATLFGEYRITPTFGINANIDYTQNISSNRIPQATAAGAAPLFYDLAWRRFQALLGVRYIM